MDWTAAEVLEPRWLLAGVITQVAAFDTWDGGIILSTDAAGITYQPSSGHLFIADSEINENSEFVGDNVFEVSAAGDSLFGEFATGNNEPTGITYNRFDGFFYVTNDDDKTVTRYDGRLDTPLLTIGTRRLDSRLTDPEGITSDLSGNLYIANGRGGERMVAVLDADLQLQSTFSVSGRVSDPEGIAYNPLNDHLYLISSPDLAIFEYTRDGTFVEEYDISGFSPEPSAPQGLTFAPTSNPNDDPAALAVYIADGMVDNGADGRIYEAIIGTGLPPGGPPTAHDQSLTTPEETALAVTLSADDPDNDPLTFTVIEGPADGTLTGSGPELTYVPNTDFNGQDRFTFRAEDGINVSNPATVTIDVTPVNDPPRALADTYSLEQGQPLDVAATAGVLANDSDADGDLLTAALVEGPTGGTVALAGDGSFLYTPDAGFSGSDGFTYRADDGAATSPPVTVTLVVNARPTADADTYRVDEDGVLTVAAAGGVLSNDADADGDPLTAVLIEPPSQGTVDLSGDGSFVYRPQGDFFGNDRFTYQADDGLARSQTAAVAISVDAVNDAPTAVEDAYSVDMNRTLDIAAADGVLANDSDIEDDSLSAVLFAGPAGGTLTLAGDGSFVYTPAAGFAGIDSFTYRADDGTDTSAAVEVTINVIDTSTPVTVSYQDGVDGYSGTRDTKIMSDDPETAFGSAETLEVDGSPDYGVLLGWDLSGVPVGSTVLAAELTLEVTNTSDDLYELYAVLRPWSEATADWTSPAAAESWQAAGAQGAGDRGSEVLGVLDGSSRGPTTVTLNEAALAVIQSWIDDPAANHGLILQDYTAASNGVDFHSREAADPASRPKLTLTYRPGNPLPPNNPPVASDDSYNTAEDGTLTVTAGDGLLANDSDADGDPLAVVLVDGPAAGTLALEADGAFTYRPHPDFAGTDSFAYRADDGTDTSPTAEVTITVAAANDPPSDITLSNNAVDEEADTSGPLTVGTLAAVDPDAGDVHTFRLTSGPGDADNATFQIVDDALQFGAGTVLDADVQGSYSVRIEVSDGNSAFAKAFLLEVIPHNDPPTDILLAPDAIAENTGTATAATVGTLSAVDPDAGDVHTFRLASGPGDADNGLFQVAADELQVVAGTVLDFESRSSYSVRVEVSDGVNTFQKALLVGVTDVNEPPTAVDDGYSLDMDQALSVPAGGGLLVNDSDPEDDPLTAVLVEGPAHGTLSLSGDGSFDYVPEAGYVGDDQFRYHADDGTNSSGTATVSITVIDTSTPVTVSFQDGVDGYAGTRDTKIKSNAADTAFGSAEELEVDGRPDYAALLSWDLSSIPAGSTVLSATLDLSVTNHSDDVYELFALTRGWVESEATWNEAATGAAWATAGAQGAGDRGSTVLGEIVSPSKGPATIELNAAGLAIIESWINDPAANHGLIFQNYTTASNGFDFHSREAADPANRPALTITYRPGAGNNSVFAASQAFPRGTHPVGFAADELAGIAGAAAERWLSALPPEQRDRAASLLEDARVEIVDLPGRELGRAVSNTVLLDRDAAGFGWFVDATPFDDREFDGNGSGSRRREPAARDRHADVLGPPVGRIDLLTVLIHEQGHLLGLGHQDSDRVMAASLATGVRRTPSLLQAFGEAAVDDFFAASADPTTTLLDGGRRR